MIPKETPIISAIARMAFEVRRDSGAPAVALVIGARRYSALLSQELDGVLYLVGYADSGERISSVVGRFLDLHIIIDRETPDALRVVGIAEWELSR